MTVKIIRKLVQKTVTKCGVQINLLFIRKLVFNTDTTHSSFLFGFKL